MKVISFLPDQRDFVFVKQTDDWYIFHDRNTPLVKVYSPTKDMTGKWCIVLSIQFNRTDNTKYPYAMTLKLFPVDKNNEQETQARITRSFFKGKFAHSLYPTLFYSAFPVNIAGQEVAHWVSYTFD
jgi:hypothetical protein